MMSESEYKISSSKSPGKVPIYTPKRNIRFQDGPGDLIGLVNKLQDKLASTGNPLKISLPQIVVVGSQCSGKSSTLESLVGKEFLPRGTGVVTRRPTVVQLIPHKEEYAIFLHKPDIKFTDFEDVKNEISEETNRNPGPEGFSSTPISLKIYSPDVLKLTVVDLPGIIRVTVDNQSEDSIKQIRQMVLEHISQPNCLILAVSPANQDISNSDALEIAKTVDPQRKRTIGVLTKLDLMDEGTDAREILENKKIPLIRGFVGVLNRSKKDTEEGRDIAYCLDKEDNFFASAPCYKDMADRMGIKYLRRVLNEQLYDHIKEYLPVVRKELTQKLASVNKELKAINDKVSFDFDDPASIQDCMIKLTLKFIEQLHIQIFGYSVSVPKGELSAGTIINFKLNKSIQDFKLPAVPTRRKLLTAIANSTGVRNCFSMSSLSLEIAFHELLSTYSEPLNWLVDEIADTLDSTVGQSSEMLDDFPSFRNELIFLIRDSISKAAAETKETLEKYLEAEMYFVNVCHKDFTFPDPEGNESLFPIKLWQFRENTGKSFDSASTSETDGGYSDTASCSGTDNGNSYHTEAIESIEASKSAQANADILAKTIERYIIIKQKHIENIAFKYIIFFLVKQVMDFVKCDLTGKILASVSNDIICRDCEKTFLKIKELESTCECLVDALNAVQTF